MAAHVRACSRASRVSPGSFRLPASTPQITPRCALAEPGAGKRRAPPSALSPLTCTALCESGWVQARPHVGDLPLGLGYMVRSSVVRAAGSAGARRGLNTRQWARRRSQEIAVQARNATGADWPSIQITAAPPSDTLARPTVRVRCGSTHRSISVRSGRERSPALVTASGREKGNYFK